MGASGPRSMSYDAYDLFDLGEFETTRRDAPETRYGNRAELPQAVHSMERAARAAAAWAHGTLAELELLSLFYDKDRSPPKVQEQVAKHCKEMVRLMGLNSFHVKSTRRQFQRYVDQWNLPDKDWQRTDWGEIADAAVKALTSESPPEAAESG
jgi:hypothetical protein